MISRWSLSEKVSETEFRSDPKFEIGMTHLNFGTKPEAAVYECFTFDARGVTIYFQKGTITAAAGGTQTVELPYSELQPLFPELVTF